MTVNRSEREREREREGGREGGVSEFAPITTRETEGSNDESFTIGRIKSSS